MHIIQSGRSSAANRAANRIANNMANNVDNGFVPMQNMAFPKKYPIDLGNGQIVFSETYRTAEEYHRAGMVEMQARIESQKATRMARIENQMRLAMKPARVPLFDRSKLAGQDKLSQLIRCEILKGGK